jgi:prefoldin subunit 5
VKSSQNLIGKREQAKQLIQHLALLAKQLETVNREIEALESLITTNQEGHCYHD